MKKSRSEPYSCALREFLARHADDRVTEAFDEVVSSIEGDRADAEFVKEAARHTLK